MKLVLLPLALSVVLLGLLLTGCEQRDALEDVLYTGDLRILTRNSPTTYYMDKGEPTGFEYRLATLFAEDLGVSLNLESRHTMDDLYYGLRRGDADIIAAGISDDSELPSDFQFTSSYDEVQPLVIYLAGQRRPRSAEDLNDASLMVLAESGHPQLLLDLQTEQPQLSWNIVHNGAASDLMALVAEGKADYALINSNEFTANHSYFPKLRVGFKFEQRSELAWLIPDRPRYASLRLAADDFMQRMQADGTLALLHEQHFGHALDVNPVDSQTFNRRMRKRLPKYEDLILEVAAEYQMDWHLLAAIAYQESHWNPHATSPTGVRGMMMLTNNTAREMNIADRLDPAQSLRGGARYFKKLRRRLPDDIYEPDRTWFALAAYNIGRGHLEDARVITEQQGGDPHLWADVSERLPLLQKSKFYQNTRYGYARGSEPVTYVKNIRHYYNILAWRDIARSRPLPPISTQKYVPPILESSSLSAL